MAGGSAMSSTPDNLVDVRGLRRVFDLSQPWLKRMLERTGKVSLTAVDDVSFDIAKGETLALVGESGSGKSTVARMVVGLLTPTRGTVFIDGVAMNGRQGGGELRTLRSRFQMIFQDPYASLNPRWRVERIIAEPIRVFGLERDEAAIRARVAALLGQVGLSPADGAKYPHEFSGGQRQRICIARALANRPEFLVCDEPTSALDVSVQAQILNLMRDLQDELGLTFLFISHDLAVVRHMAERGGRDVPRPHRRDRRQPRTVRAPAPPLHAHAARRGARSRHDRPQAPAGRRGNSEPDQPAARLHLPSPLSARGRPMQPRDAAAALDWPGQGTLSVGGIGSEPGACQCWSF
jgi:ABC-type oligopeptide transport system ATPase subunit